MVSSIALHDWSPWESGHIDPDAAYAYARATSDLSPWYLDHRLVPLMYPTALAMPSMGATLQRCLGPDAIVGTRSAMHAQHWAWFHRPCTPDMDLRWRCCLSAVKVTSAGPLVTVHSQFRTLDDQPLADHYWGSMFVGGTLQLPVSGEPEQLDDPSATVHRDPFASIRLPVDLDQGFRYGGATGDRVPHAIDDRAARDEGLPGKIIQGLCTLAMCTGAVVDKVASGDPRRIERISVRFAAPLRPGAHLTVNCYDTDDTADSRRHLTFDATAGDTTILRNGWVTLRKPG